LTYLVRYTRSKYPNMCIII